MRHFTFFICWTCAFDQLLLLHRCGDWPHHHGVSLRRAQALGFSGRFCLLFLWYKLSFLISYLLFRRLSNPCVSRYIILESVKSKLLSLWAPKAVLDTLQAVLFDELSYFLFYATYAPTSYSMLLVLWSSLTKNLVPIMLVHLVKCGLYGCAWPDRACAAGIGALTKISR